MKRILFCLAVAVLHSAFMFSKSADTGDITGQVVDAETAEPITGAAVLLEGTGTGAYSDVDGNFRIADVMPGTYNLKLTLMSYQTLVVSNVLVKRGEETTVNVLMSVEVVDLSEGNNGVEIVAYRDAATLASLITEIREANSVSSGIGQAQIQKSNDGNAAEVARRVPGVTVIDNRFVMVRGLSERYNAVMLNNALVPSLETDVKSFSFDMIPSGLIERFLIYKSPAADLPGEFAGGAINVFTKNIPQKDFELNAGMTLGYRPQTTYKNFRTNASSKTDWMGFDNGSRNLPTAFPANVRDVSDNDELQSLGRSLPNNWGFDEGNAGADLKWTASIGRKWKLNNAEIGNISAINYSTTNQSFVNHRLDYNTWDNVLNESDTIFNYSDNIYQQQSRVGAMFNCGLRSNGTNIRFNNFFNQNGMQENTFRNGVNMEEGNYRNEIAYRYNQRTMLTTQLVASQQLFDERGKAELTIGYSLAHRSDPDWRRIRYTKPLDGSYENWQAYIPFGAQPFYMGRLFLDMNENIPMTAFNYEHKIFKTGESAISNDETFFTIKGGLYWEDKERSFGVRNIGYAASSFSTYGNTALLESPADEIFNPSNINTTDGLKIDEDTKGSDSYTASNRLFAYYLQAIVPYNNWKVILGIRVEDNLQQLNSFNVQEEELNIRRDTTLLLPSINVAYNVTDNTLIRAAYGRTVNRPEFREIAPYYFYDFVFNSIYSGNAQLTFATIDNYDVRYEWYPTPSEVVSVGAFYKEFENPIELYFAPGVGSGGTRAFVPGNAPGAVSYGLELDMRKRLNDLFHSGTLQNISVVANASFLKSEIQLSATTAESGVNTTRPMMGQSPYIVNAGLYWQDDTLGISAGVMYNVIGPRIVIVGIPGVPEVYEMPRGLLDFNITKTIGENFTVRFSASDILNRKMVLLQDANGDEVLDSTSDQQMQFFQRGSYFTLGVGYKFRK